MTVASQHAHPGTVCLTFDFDTMAAWMGSFQARTPGILSRGEFGGRVGIYRILDVLARYEIPGTFFIPGYTADSFPDAVREIAAQGHEIGHHGYLHEQMKGIDAATEARYLDRGLEALDRVAGLRPVGYRAPWWETNWHTPRLLSERGFLYDSSLLDGDIPYRFAVEPGSADTLIEIPVDWALDDWEQYACYPGVMGSGIIESPAKVLEMWGLEAEAHHLEGGCFVLTNHPFISGRPSKAVALERLIEKVRNMDGMWVTTLGEIAAHTENACAESVVHTRFEVPTFPDVDIRPIPAP